MPRQARIKSVSGNYHIVLRGINKQRIFEEQQDYNKFLWILNDAKKQRSFSLFAWCLMSNHIHLLINERSENVSEIIKGLGSRFVFWYNSKYDRTGHLFEGRYLSEPVDNQEYFLKVLRYIHLNPVKAGICEKPGDYKYSSYSYYFHSGRYSENEMVFGMITRKELEQFHEEKVEDICLDIDGNPKRKLTDERAAAIVKQTVGCDHVALVQTLSDELRERSVLSLFYAGGSLRQISRLTGLSTRTVQYYLEKH